MLSNLNTKKMHNVEYFGLDRSNSKNAFGLYVFGNYEPEEPYSVLVKRRLYSCLIYVQRYLNEDDLVAIYYDINAGTDVNFPGFESLAVDINRSLFNKVLFWDLELINEIDYLHNQLICLSKSVRNLELFDLDGNLFQIDRLPLNQLLGV